MEEYVLVIGLGKPYSFTPEGSNETLSGCTMWYLNSADLTKPFVDEESGLLGLTPLKQKMPVEFYETAKKVGLPCKAKVVYGMKTSGGSQSLYIKGLDFISDRK